MTGVSGHAGAAANAETIHLVSFGGHPNFEDEFVTAAWLRFLARARPDAEVLLDCPTPGTATSLFDGLHPRLKVIDAFWRVVNDTEDLDAEEGAARVTQLVTDLGTPRWDHTLLTARRASTVHLIGGGHLVARWPHHERVLQAALAQREVTGARLVATGLGLLPARDPATLRAALGAFDHATVRDEASAEVAGVPHTTDDAFLGLQSLASFGAPTPTDGGSGDVYLCLQSDLMDEDAFETMVEGVRGLLTSSAYAGRAVHYVESIPGADYVAYERLADLIPAENFVPFVAAWDHGLAAAPGQVWLTTRHQLHLLAASVGAAGVAFAFDEDSQATHEGLAALGTAWPVVPTGDGSVPEPVARREFRLGAGRLHRAKVAEAEGLYPRHRG